MENKRKRDQVYYERIVSKLKKFSTFTTAELYKVIGQVDIELDVPTSKAGNSAIVTKLRDLLGENLEEIKDTETKTRGRGYPSIFSIKGDAVALIAVSFAKQVARQASATKQAVATKRAADKKIAAYTIQKRVMDRIWILLSEYHKRGCTSMKFSEATKIVSIPVGSGLLGNWKKGCERVHLILDFQIMSKAVEKEIVFRNIKDTILQFASTYKKLYDIDLKVGKTLHISQVKVAEHRNEKTISSVNSKFITWAMAGMISHNERSMYLDDVCATLSRQFDTRVGKQELLELIKVESELVLTGQGNAVNLRDKDTSFINIDERCSPKNIKQSVLLVSSLGQDKIEAFGLGVEIINELSDTTIYKVVYDKTLTSTQKLCRLCRTFRGTDMFLDEEVTKKLHKEIKIQDSLINKDRLQWEIEQYGTFKVE